MLRQECSVGIDAGRTGNDLVIVGKPRKWIEMHWSQGPEGATHRRGAKG